MVGNPQERTSIQKATSVYRSSLLRIPDIKNQPLITTARNVAQLSLALFCKSPFADLRILTRKYFGIAIKNNESSMTKFINKNIPIIIWALQNNPWPHSSLLVIGITIQNRMIQKKFTYQTHKIIR